MSNVFKSRRRFMCNMSLIALWFNWEMPFDVESTGKGLNTPQLDRVHPDA